MQLAKVFHTTSRNTVYVGAVVNKSTSFFEILRNLLLHNFGNFSMKHLTNKVSIIYVIRKWTFKLNEIVQSEGR